MKKALAIGIGTLSAALVASCLAFWKVASYRGPVEKLSSDQQKLAKRLSAHVEKLAGDIGARSLTRNPEGLENAAAYIEETLKESGFDPARQTFSVSGYLSAGLPGATHATQSASNIIVEIPGTTKASEVVVIGAHYDSVGDCPGANDNGSGVAALLEIARALSSEKFARTVRLVAFTNEEPPFFRSNDMGSYRYAVSCKKHRDNIVAMLSLETIGYYTDKSGTQQFPVGALGMLYPRTGNFLAFVGNMDSRSLLAKCVTSFNSAVKFPVEMLAAPAGLAGIDFSDQLNFWRVGYPGIMVTDTALYRYPHYHTSQDTPDKVNYNDLARVTAGLIKVVKDLGNDFR